MQQFVIVKNVEPRILNVMCFFFTFKSFLVAINIMMAEYIQEVDYT